MNAILNLQKQITTQLIKFSHVNSMINEESTSQSKNSSYYYY